MAGTPSGCRWARTRRGEERERESFGRLRFRQPRCDAACARGLRVRAPETLERRAMTAPLPLALFATAPHALPGRRASLFVYSLFTILPFKPLRLHQRPTTTNTHSTRSPRLIYHSHHHHHHPRRHVLSSIALPRLLLTIPSSTTHTPPTMSDDEKYDVLEKIGMHQGMFLPLCYPLLTTDQARARLASSARSAGSRTAM